MYEFVKQELWARLLRIPKLLIATANWGTRSSQSSRTLTVKLGLSTASAHSPVLRPVPEPQNIRPRAQRVPRVGKSQFIPKEQYSYYLVPSSYYLVPSI